MKDSNRQERNKDIHLDIPSEANREKHINFREAEEDNGKSSDTSSFDDFAKERKREWEQGIAEGKEDQKE